jgi:competence protein ComEC
MVMRRHLVALVFVLTAFITASCNLSFGQNSPVSPEAPLTITFLDVGQADCIFVQAGTKTLLIDAGTNDGSASLVSRLQQKGVHQIDVLIGTHPHEDHIGGMDTIIKNFAIGAIYLPDVTSTTPSFEDVLTAISDKGLKISIPRLFETLTLGQSTITFLAPNSSSYDEINNYSIVTRLQFGNTSFLFSGDAQNHSEQEMLPGGFNLKSDVLKIGHHGSFSSTSPAFLAAVSPRYAVIFVAKDNDYGHPHQETLQKLSAAGVQVYRTDLNGDIVFRSDGSGLTIETQR